MDEISKHLITALVSSLTGALAAILVARYSKTHEERKGESRHLSAKTESDIAKAASDIAAGSTVAVTNLLRSIEYLKQELAEVRAENVALEKIRTERDTRIDELEAKQELDLKETTELRVHVIKVDEKYKIMKGIAAKLVNALQKNDPPIPIPDLNGDLASLGDSVQGLVWKHSPKEPKDKK